ncbi:uncharacterized protein [Danio rerio]|uniref:Uncharacterized protein n=1 Tax=Danio rerio TaxID=7955 RepID=A0AC58J2C9_DANRE
MLRKRPIKTSMVLARSVTGQCLDTLGVLVLGMRLGTELLQHDFQVVRGAHHPIILGWDFLQKHHALIDVTNEKMSLWNFELPLLSTGHEAAACCNVSVLASTKLPPWSETVITACVAGATAVSPVPTAYTGVLEPNTASNVAVAHTLSEVRNGLTTVRVLNTTEEDIEIHAGQHLDFHQPFLLYTDASASAIGAVLAQEKGTQETVIAYASHVLTKAERKWSTYDRELWAIVWAVRHFRHYLYKQHFFIITYHKPLMGLRKIPIDSDRTGRRARWALELDPFEWTVIHRKGLKHANADALSRRQASDSAMEIPASSSGEANVGSPVSKSDSGYLSAAQGSKVLGPSVSITHVSPTLSACVNQEMERTPSLMLQLATSESSFIEHQKQDPVLKEVISWKLKGLRPPYRKISKRSQEERIFWKEFTRLTLLNGLLCREMSIQVRSL